MLKCLDCGQTDPGRFVIRRRRESVLRYKRTEFGVPVFGTTATVGGFGSFSMLCDCGAVAPITTEGWDYE